MEGPDVNDQCTRQCLRVRKERLVFPKLLLKQPNLDVEEGSYRRALILTDDL